MQMPGHFFTILRVAVNGERVEKLCNLHRIYCSLRRSCTFAEVLHLAGMPQTRAEAIQLEFVIQGEIVQDWSIEPPGACRRSIIYYRCHM